MATITIYNAADTSIVTYKLSNEEGVFKLNGIPLHTPCRAVITLQGIRFSEKIFYLAILLNNTISVLSRL